MNSPSMSKEDYYKEVICVECGSGDREKQLLLCEKSDRGYHMGCLKPIVARVTVPIIILPSSKGSGLGSSVLYSDGAYSPTDFLSIAMKRIAKLDIKRM
ncbi:hypothetical protein L1987_46587 [Smallanthus sonchifolius]|uniref:Uncharacterized protein n=1 Tax=Smallanthus sonchifolius TaxID=185202 RepID=A0ACB9G069_9ASTR|nr:hypothetical protein L1987_46587 [Smallanthus sonchifolius]